MKTLRWSDLTPNDTALHVAYVVKSTASSWDLHRHDFFEVFFVDSGKGSQRWPEGSHRTVHGGHLVFVRPPDTHGFTALASTEPFTLINVAFPRTAWLHLRDRYDLARLEFFNESTLRPPQVELIGASRKAVSRLFRDLLHRERSAIVRDGFLLSLAALLLTSHEVPELDRAPPWLKKTLLGAENDIEVLLNGPAGLARRSGYSAPHLTRVMRESLGLTPGQWILAHRLRRAGQLLEATSLSIAEVAAESGFENLSHFHRTFRKARTLTPAAYRRRHARQVV